MLDISYIRNNPGIVKKAVADKLMNTDIDRLLELDGEIREIGAKADAFRSEKARG